MRIRKNAKLSPLLFSSSTSSFSQQGVETFQTHVCQLNQSPWDVMPFDSTQFDAADDNSFTNGSAAAVATDSFGPVESVASMMDTEENNKTVIIADVATMALEDNHDNSYQRGGYKKVSGKKSLCCNAMDANGWPCKNGVVKHGQSFCNHHLSLLRSNNKKSTTTLTSTTPGVSVGSRRAGVKSRTMKKSLSSDPNEFYYYSGFGPRWGKRRGDRNGQGSRNDNTSSGENNSTMMESGNVAGTSLEIDNEGFGFVDDDEEEDEDCQDHDNNNGKKRMRKQVKERSLKSLM